MAGLVQHGAARAGSSRRHAVVGGLLVALAAACVNSGPGPDAGTTMPMSVPTTAASADTSVVSTSPVPTTTDATTPSTADTSGGIVSVPWGALLTGPTNEDEIDGIAAGVDASVWVTGKFEQVATLGGVRIESSGAADIPLARFDADGSVVFVDRFGSTGEDNFFDIDANDFGAVATGIITGTVEFGDHTVTSAGDTDCVIVAFDNAGGVRWATRYGGRGPDGCNEVVLVDGGDVVTSLDTAGGWNSPAGTISTDGGRETLLLRLDATGSMRWARIVGGLGTQRGKAIAAGPGGHIAFGGDTGGALRIGDERLDRMGAGADAWLTYWSPDGDLLWATTWGAAGADIVKGAAIGAGGIYAVGTFDGEIEVDGTARDSRDGADLLIARFSSTGTLDWTTTISGTDDVAGAEVTASDDGGLVFAGIAADDLRIGSADGETVIVDDTGAGSLFLVGFEPDGSVAFAESIPGTADARPDEIDRIGSRVYLDVVVRGSDNTAGAVALPADRKDGAVFAVDLPSR